MQVTNTYAQLAALLYALAFFSGIPSVSLHWWAIPILYFLPGIMLLLAMLASGVSAVILWCYYASSGRSMPSRSLQKD